MRMACASGCTHCLHQHLVQDMYDKQRGKKKTRQGSDADSDGGQVGFGSSRPHKKQLMSDEQVGKHVQPVKDK